MVLFDSKFNLGVMWNYDCYIIILCIICYGEVEDLLLVEVCNEIILLEWIIDLDVCIVLIEGFIVFVGVNNLFDVYLEIICEFVDDVIMFLCLFLYLGFLFYGFIGCFVYGKVLYSF